MNKTILFSTAIIASAVIIIFLPTAHWYISYLKDTEAAKEAAKIEIAIETAKTNNIIQIDKFTNCIQITMSESRQSGKIIDAEKAKDICMHVKNIDARKR